MTVGIALFGVLMIYSAGYYRASVFGQPFRFVKSQLQGLGIGFVLMLAISKIDYQIFIQKTSGRYSLSLSHVAYIVALALQIAVLFIGAEHNGAKRWIEFGPIQFQPSEISKIAAILFISYAVYRNRRALDSFTGFLCIMAYMMPLIILIAKENLSSAIIIGGISIGMCFVASNKKGYFIICALLLACVMAVYIIFGDPFRMERVQIWLNVETHPNALQIKQGLYAIASGGLLGKGLGQSMQKLGFVPEAQNDMIFSIICEELGLFGAFCVILLFLLMIWRFMIIANNAADLYGTLIVSGIMAHIAIQVILNIGVVTNTIPNTGITLPFISYGGTSTCFLLAEMGLALSVSRGIRLEGNSHD